MAKKINNMSVGALKAHPSQYPTPVARAFAALPCALARHIETEREIEDVDIWDLAFRDWLTDAEHAYADVTTHLFNITAAEVVCEDDKPLVRMAMLIDALVGSEDPDTFEHLYRLLPQFEDLFQCHGQGPAARHRDNMLCAVRRHIDTMASLLTYDGVIETEQTEMVQIPQL
ncbi:hypothetical protein OS189_17125 [Sulfitobacter sp. F26169L]|uniref:hypothetical protein n=1 Tax=Sulfitobacter sp. F26169L TaxID=2996015 RepID=UPI002260E915|nr:hypothetical protein [Sulfitobacter sp. F26169L]MCX7568067.1 hypothetical protein [Sulfitobacter sp. F26169L]